MPKNDLGFVSFGDDRESIRRGAMVELLKTCPLPENELLHNIGLFLTPQTLGRILFMDFLYRQIVNVPGTVMEFGCRWGQNLALFTALRGIYEPFNRLRKIVAFDTFEGFPSVQTIDGPQMTPGAFGTAPGYDAYLAELISLQEAESPLSHLVKHEIIKGDVSRTVPAWVARNPYAIVALAYFDLDIYQPTKDALTAIRGRLTKGSVLGFDEANDPACPGETVAVAEVLGLDRYPIRRFPQSARTSYIVID
jgi:hypothetical protein